jgi:hypothetical protein
MGGPLYRDHWDIARIEPDALHSSRSLAAKSFVHLRHHLSIHIRTHFYKVTVTSPRLSKRSPPCGFSDILVDFDEVTKGRGRGRKHRENLAGRSDLPMYRPQLLVGDHFFVVLISTCIVLIPCYNGCGGLFFTVHHWICQAELY